MSRHYTVGLICIVLNDWSPVHTGDYSRRFRWQFVAENGNCRQKRRLSLNSATVAKTGDCRRRPNSATIVASVDRPLVLNPGLTALQWLNSVGLIQRSAAVWCCSAFITWTGWTHATRSDSESWC